jgi:hypothetical protein
MCYTANEAMAMARFVGALVLAVVEIVFRCFGLRFC